MNRLAQDINGIRTAFTMKRELDAHRERERSLSVSGKLEEDDNAREIMDSFQEHVGPSLNALAVSTSPASRRSILNTHVNCRMWHGTICESSECHFSVVELEQNWA